MKRPTPVKTILCAKRMGENLTTWRKLRNLTADQLADMSAVSRGTISRLENGDSSVSLATFLNVCNVLDIMPIVEDATNPYETDLGRARADQKLPQRVRRS